VFTVFTDMPTYCIQCGVEKQVRVAVGVDEYGESACEIHVAAVPREWAEDFRKLDFVETTVAQVEARYRKCWCGGKMGHKGRHRGVERETVVKRDELNGKIEALATVIEMLARIEGSNG